jgi:hypothetical protein
LDREAGDGIFLIMDKIGPIWSRRCEVEIMHVAILGLKSCPKEVPCAAIHAFQFFSQVCSKLYGYPTDVEKDVIQDPLLVAGHVVRKVEEGAPEEEGSSSSTPSDAVIQMLLSELASVKQIVR